MRAETAILFNEICLDNILLPKFTNVRLYNKATQREPFTGEFRRNLVKHELTITKKRRTELEKKVQ